VAARAKNLPRWLVPAVLNRWVSPPRAFRHPLGRFFASPAALLREIGQRIADPLTATISLNGPLNNAPRLPFQVADAAWRAAKVCVNLPEHLSAQRRARAAREEG
jgi:hypothetical protein